MYVVPQPVGANTDPYSGYTALPAGSTSMLAPTTAGTPPGPPGWQAPPHFGAAGLEVANEGPYSGYAALPTPAARGLAGAVHVLTPEIYDGAPGGAPDYAAGPLPFGGVSPHARCARNVHVTV